jgi:hypothetical protein
MEDIVHAASEKDETLKADFEADGSALAWCFSILFATLGQYNSIVERRKA